MYVETCTVYYYNVQYPCIYMVHAIICIYRLWHVQKLFAIQMSASHQLNCELEPYFDVTLHCNQLVYLMIYNNVQSEVTMILYICV